MKWKTTKSPKKSKPRPFLVLPLIEVDNTQDNNKSMKNKPNLKLFTRTFTPKEKINDENIRPLTATLEKPQVLDIRFIDKIDMSLVRKEFLCITNLCRHPIAVSKARRKPPPFNQRRHGSIKPSILPSKGVQKVSRPGTSDDSWEDESSCSQTPTATIRKQDQKRQKMIKQQTTLTKKHSKKTSQNDSNNNFNTYRVSKKRMIVPLPCNACGRPDQPERFHSHPEVVENPMKKMEKKVQVKNIVQKPVAMKYKSNSVEKKRSVSPKKPTSSNQMPSSSMTNDERNLKNRENGLKNREYIKLKNRENVNLKNRENVNLKYRDNVNLKNRENVNLKNRENVDLKNRENIDLKNVENVTFKYRENIHLKNRENIDLKNRENIDLKNRENTDSKNRENIDLKNRQNTDSKNRENIDSKRKNSGKGPRTLTCYICGREFGTMSLPLHEPKCLEKWERENASLPAEMRRKKPVKPEKAFTKQEYNNYAWESSQANLVPCKNCKRTFYPDRLIVHQRSCKPAQTVVTTKYIRSEERNERKSPASLMTSPNPSVQQKGIPCSVCGRLFGTQSIKFHEPQCLKKWHLQNDNLPVSKREPMYSELAQNVAEKKVTPPETPSSQESTEASSKKPPMFPCYLCGRLFSVNSIYIHEPQCLKKWKNENDKLPPHKRKAIPMKPEIKFTRDGKVDHQAMADANWRSHLEQLVPCKNCGRTFNPDRVCVHENFCKGEKRSSNNFKDIKVEMYH